MSKIDRLNLKVEKLLSKAVLEVLEVVKETVVEYQERTARTKRENQRLKRRLQELQDTVKLDNNEFKSSSPVQVKSELHPSENQDELCGNSDLNSSQNNITEKCSSGPYEELDCEEPFESMTGQFHSKDTFHNHHNAESNGNSPVLNTDPSLVDKSSNSDSDVIFMPNKLKIESTPEEDSIITNYFDAASLGRLTTDSLPSNEQLYNEPDTVFTSTQNDRVEPLDLINPSVLSNKYKNYVRNYSPNPRSTRLRTCEKKVQKNYSCLFCSRTFKHAGDFKKHNRVHTGEKPYCCPVCGKSFSQSGCLTVHLRYHTGEKPFDCRICGKSFSHSSNMKKHEQTCSKWSEGAHMKTPA